jgi:hypothetical protein
LLLAGKNAKKSIFHLRHVPARCPACRQFGKMNEFALQGTKMTAKSKLVIIPKEKAVFWLDKNGQWHNEHGKFEHKRIISFFHASIRRDKQGYFLYQENEQRREKVYFPYEECALFAVDVIHEGAVFVVLNTGKKLKLMPRKLVMRNDDLYMQTKLDTIKFLERGLTKISELISVDNDRYFITVNQRRYAIRCLR